MDDVKSGLNILNMGKYPRLFDMMNSSERQKKENSVKREDAIYSIALVLCLLIILLTNA